MEKLQEEMDNLKSNTDQSNDHLQYDRDPQYNIPSNMMKLLKNLDNFASD